MAPAFPTYEVISTRRLIIRPAERRDLDAYQRWPRGDDPLLAIFAVEQRSELELDLLWAMRQLDITSFHWTVLQQTEIVGQMEIRAIDREQGNAQFGMQLGAPFVGQGLGSEMLQGWLPAYFGHWHFRTLRLDVACWNQRARRLYERTGFRTTGEFWRASDLGGDRLAIASAARPECFRRGNASQYTRWYQMELGAPLVQ